MPPAARISHLITRSMVAPGMPPIPLAGGPRCEPGVANLRIEGNPAACEGNFTVQGGAKVARFPTVIMGE